MADLFCSSSTCWVRDEHLEDCTDDRCRGCRPAYAEDGVFCLRCSAQLRSWLGEIPELYADVVDPASASTTATEKLGVVDPVMVRLPAGAVPAPGRQPRVSGNPEESLAARYVEQANGSVSVHDTFGDQVGDPPPAVLLDSWCRDWQTVRNMAETLPPPTVDRLCRWLSDRLPWALDNHGAMPDFHAEIRELHSRLWREAGRSEARPELCVGVPCRRCDLLCLWRTTDGSGDVECHNPDCRTVYRAADYDQWVALVAAAARRDWKDDHAATA